MKFALIAQPNRGDMLAIEYRLTYHMALAQYIHSDETYRNFYKLMRMQDHFIMLDNGAAENGHSIGIENVVAAADMIGGVDEIIMPDVLDEKRATVAATGNALQFVPINKRAVVPQGKNWEEWEQCAMDLVGMGCRTICVAKRYEALPGGRTYALEIIQKHRWHHIYDVHLLGCYRNPLREIGDVRLMPWVRGIDTAAPISYAQHNETLDHPKWHSLEWDRPFDYDTAMTNMDLILEECHAHNTPKPSIG